MKARSKHHIVLKVPSFGSIKAHGAIKAKETFEVRGLSQFKRRKERKNKTLQK
jgi:hypothetical protein